MTVNLTPPAGLIDAFSWVPNDGDLVVSFDNGRSIGSLYLSKVDVPIAFSATPTPPNGNPFYTTEPPDDESNPQTVPMPLATTSVTLSATSAETYYVFAYSGIYRPSMEGPSQT